ncbi:hypothetical protein [Thiomicrorhabdus chilensis]|uniref:hypothetical protein n=1 Tax=Thiomicrorhabdus chilensis TaxID=63656 RepID=UPI0004131756|nr:hypothetical protein [Thiomicrorhabdus chilensis]
MKFKLNLVAAVIAASLALTGCSSGPDELVFKDIPTGDVSDKGQNVALLMSKETVDAIGDYISKNRSDREVSADRNLDEFKRQLDGFPALADDDKERYIAYFESKPQRWETSFNQSVNLKQKEIEALKQKIANHDKKVVELTAKKAELIEKKNSFQSGYTVYKNLNKQAQKLLADNNVRPADLMSRSKTDMKYKEVNQDQIACAFTLNDYGTEGYSRYWEQTGAPVWLNDKCYRVLDANLLEIVLTSFYANNPDGFESEGVKEKVLTELMPAYKDYILKDINEVQPTNKEYNDVVKFLYDARGYKGSYLRQISNLQTEIKRINQALSIKDENVRNRDSYYREAYYEFNKADNLYLSTRIQLRNKVNMLKHLMDEFEGDIDIVTEQVNEPIDISGSDFAKVYMVPNDFSGIDPFSYIKDWAADYSSDRSKEKDTIELYFGELFDQRALMNSSNVDADIAALKQRHFTLENGIEEMLVWKQFFGDEDDANLFRFLSGRVLSYYTGYASYDKDEKQAMEKIQQSLKENSDFQI